jgi:CheY-like chemotaxis protein
LLLLAPMLGAGQHSGARATRQSASPSAAVCVAGENLGTPYPPRRRFPRGRLEFAVSVDLGLRTRMTDNSKTVLLVEDNEDNRIVYSTILQHFGYRVMEALNGEEGIAKARAEKPDLILMDISIPIIDGWEATQVLKRDPDTRHIPIIALTAHALASDREKAMEVGCDSYLAKPCEPKAVVSEVQKFLGKRDGR